MEIVICKHLNDQFYNMQVTVLFFGQLKDITGVSSVSLENTTDTNQLMDNLKTIHPGLLAARFIIAVDKKITDENIVLENGSTVALLPPYSGG
jgi:molybdopterin converting factor small subunit